MRNINKVGSKFTVSLHVESADNLLTANEVVFVWERNAKVVSTKPVSVDRDTHIAHFGGEVLSQYVTLFKKKKESSPFEDKVFRLSLRNGSERGKVIGKIDINFSLHVGIPSSSKRICAPLSNGSQVVMRVESKFIAEAIRKKNSRGTSSVGSSAIDADNDSEFDPQDVDTDLGDLDDLDVGEPLETPSSTSAPRAPPSSTTRSAAPRRPPLAPSASMDEPAAPPMTPLHRKPSAPSPGRDPAPRSRGASPARAKRSNEGIPNIPLPGLGRRTASRDSNDVPNSLNSSSAAPVNNASSNTEVDSLHRENRMLQRRNNDLQSRVDDLERKLDSTSFGFDNSHDVDELLEENSRIKAYAEELEVRLRREPSYTEVVRELRETKMALAIINMEKEQLKNEIRVLKK